ncbi:hypothetical protein HML84_13325 [Alcanivorax sp. IO_7]|nr:hypothetical protein HML84_13325 [Alcanivorax sp. IO_7]
MARTSSPFSGRALLLILAVLIGGGAYGFHEYQQGQSRAQARTTPRRCRGDSPARSPACSTGTGSNSSGAPARPRCARAWPPASWKPAPGRRTPACG